MSDRARKKHLKEQKRKQKQLSRRRELSVSPYRRLGSVGEIEACYINSNWQTEGLASIQFIRDTSSGLAMASFLVDFWCIGLKDAFGSINLLREEVETNLNHARSQFSLTRVDPEIARKLIASAIRFSRQNGFRLPRHYERFIALAGGVGEIESADLSNFGKDGKLCYVGRKEDLSSRLMSCSLEEFIGRPDVNVTFLESADGFDGSDAFDADDDEEEVDYFERYRILVDEIPHSLAATFRTELLERGEPAHPRLEEGIKLVFAKILTEGNRGDPHDPNDKRALAAHAISLLAASEVLGDSPEVPADLVEASKQASALITAMYCDLNATIDSDPRLAAMIDGLTC